MTSSSDTPSLTIMRAAAKARPCPWCYADVGQPCRANRGDGPELTRYVHPMRVARETTEIDK